MTPTSGGETQELERLAAAAVWRVALTEAEQDSSEDFEAWLSEHPANAEAWRQVQAPWIYIGERAGSPQALVARRQALRRARRAQRHGRAALPWSFGRLAACVGALVVIAVAGAGLWAAAAPDVYSTDLGERRTVVLRDGSRVALDSGTLLKVKLGRDARRLELVRGQARFDVAHDATRPFSVRAQDQVVVATGTSFNVDLLGAKVLVTLIEGKVIVLKDSPASLIALAPRPPRAVLARLTAGQQLVAAKPSGPASGGPVAAPPRVATANLDRAIAWESGQLVFQDEPLGAVAERVSRYSATPLSVVGPAANLRISGVFNTGDMPAFVDAVQRGLPVHAERTEGGVVLKMTDP